MSTLSVNNAKSLIAEMENAATTPSTWETWYATKSKQHVLLRFPCGELFNPNIRGYLIGWKMSNSIAFERIPDKARLKAHGLEGLACVSTSLVTALLVYRDLPQFRCEITITD